MRHYNPTCSSYLWNPLRRKGDKVTRPYFRPYTYTKPSAQRTYIKVIQFISDHPNCSRFDIQVGVFGYRDVAVAKALARGNQSSLFSNLLYDDLIDYDKNYRYTVTEKGMKLLKQAYLNDMAKLVKSK